MVSMKQYDVDHKDRDMVMEFANLAHGTSSLCVTMPLYGTPFEVHPAFGVGNKSNQILGLLHQHMDIAAHCRAMNMEWTPRKLTTTAQCLLLTFCSLRSSRCCLGQRLGVEASFGVEAVVNFQKHCCLLQLGLQESCNVLLSLGSRILAMFCVCC